MRRSKTSVVEYPLECIAQHLAALGKGRQNHIGQLFRIPGPQLPGRLGNQPDNGWSTLGGGSKLSGGTSISHSIQKRYCSMTD